MEGTHNMENEVIDGNSFYFMLKHELKREHEYQAVGIEVGESILEMEVRTR